MGNSVSSGIWDIASFSGVLISDDTVLDSDNSLSVCCSDSVSGVFALVSS